MPPEPGALSRRLLEVEHEAEREGNLMHVPTVTLCHIFA